MHARQVAVVVGSLLLGFSLGAYLSDIAPHAENGATAGLGMGLGLGLILASFVRD